MRDWTYICFRYFIVPIKLSLFTQGIPKEERKTLFQQNFLINKDYEFKKTDYAIRIIEANESVFFGKLSKKAVVDHYDKTPSDITESEQESWPYLEFVCDSDEEQQLFIVRYNTKLFTKVAHLKKALEGIANKTIPYDGFSISFESLVDEYSFWGIAEEADKIAYVYFSLESPNIFGGKIVADKTLRSVRQMFNNTNLEFKLENKNAGLEVPRDQIEPYREYADKGGGFWKIRTLFKKKWKTTSSTENAKKYITKPPIENKEDLHKGNKVALEKALNYFRKRS